MKVYPFLSDKVQIVHYWFIENVSKNQYKK